MKLEPGARYGHLTVTKRASFTHWECLCDCGTVVNKHVTNVARSSICTKFCQFNPLRKHSQSGDSKRTKEYSTWKNIKTRCFNPNYDQWADYGGRGITMCPTWTNDFRAFFAYVGPAPSKEHTIDRINNDGNYEPGNVHWVTRSENYNNKRNNVVISYKGVSKTATQWAKDVGIPPRIVLERIRSGWSAEETLETLPK